MELRLTMVLRCSVCGQVLDEELRRETSVAVALWGVVAFGICPSCGLEVKKPYPDEYIERAQSFVAERQKSSESDRELVEENAERDIAQGEFELAVAKPGRYRLLLESTYGERGMQMLVATLDLGLGENPWQLDLATSTLEVLNLPASEDSDPSVVHLWSRGEELLCLTALFPDAEGRCLATRVPVGQGGLALFDQNDPEPRGWPLLAECEVVAGKTAQIVLP